MKSKILGVSGGNGVILFPFKDNLLGNIEPRAIFHTPHDIQWGLNFKAPFDKSSSAIYSKNVDVIIGAPDCGHSSVFSYSRAKKLANPADNESLAFFISQVLFYKPKVFMMENLPKALENLGEDFEKWLKDYRLKILIGPVSNFGNSQVTRIRLVVVGIRKDLPKEADECVELDKNKIYLLKTEGELLKGLNGEDVGLGHVREPDDYMVPLYYKGERKISVAKARELWNTEFKELKKWPVNSGNLVNQPGVYRNFKNDNPLTVRKQSRQFNHEGNMLSPREMARIQGIPDHFKLWIDPTHRLYSINKARATVAKSPPYEIASWFHSVVSELEMYYK